MAGGKKQVAAKASTNVQSSGSLADAGVAGGQGRRKSRDGIVVSAKMNKTIVVTVERLTQHSKYGKYIRRSKKYYVHDEKSECGVGDSVRIVETAPISKLKRWRLAEITTKAA